VIYLFLTIAAVLPAVLLVWYFQARDTFPEPPRVLWTTFALGCLSVIPAVLLGVSLEPLLEPSHALSSAAFEAFVIAALCEEACKLAVLLGYSFRHSAFDEPMDGIVYGATASLGFAALENIMYVLDGGFGLAVLRGMLSVPGHAAYGAVMGYYVGRARVDRERRWSLVARGLLAAIVLHGLYDFPLMLAGADTVAGQQAAPAAGAVDPAVFAVLVLLWFATVIGGWLWTIRLVHHTRRGQAPPAGPAMPPPAFDEVPPAWAAVESLSVAVDAPREAAPAVAGWRLVAAWTGVVGGGTVASAAFLFSALAAVAAASGDVPRENVGFLAIGVFAIGVVPGLVGFAAFVLGVRRLNRAR
jgi:hypothetical protein